MIDDPPLLVVSILSDMAQLYNAAASTYLYAARHGSRLAIMVEESTVDQLAKTGEGRGRDRAFGQIRLASCASGAARRNRRATTVIRRSSWLDRSTRR